MRREGNKIVLGRKNCTHCQEGTTATHQPCPECKGTGRGKRGKIGGCKACFNGHIWNHDIRTICQHCKGNYAEAEAENFTDYLPKDVWPSLTFKVYRSNRPQSGNEYLLGIGCVYSCSDYGRSRNMSDADLIEMVRTDSPSHQASKICDEQGNICNHIGIFMNNNGYSVRAVFNPAETIATICEREANDYMHVGATIAANGGNGTLGAIYK